MSEQPGKTRHLLPSVVRWLFAVAVATLIVGAIGAPRLGVVTVLEAIPGWVSADKVVALFLIVCVIACLILISDKMTSNIVRIVNAVRAHRPPPTDENEQSRQRRWFSIRRRVEQR